VVGEAGLARIVQIAAIAGREVRRADQMIEAVAATTAGIGPARLLALVAVQGAVEVADAVVLEAAQQRQLGALPALAAPASNGAGASTRTDSSRSGHGGWATDSSLDGQREATITPSRRPSGVGSPGSQSSRELRTADRPALSSAARQGRG